MMLMSICAVSKGLDDAVINCNSFVSMYSISSLDHRITHISAIYYY